ncbi:hypothetical protein PG2009B_1724 [Bifidobacterium pseudolongum subsp. globosum]|nr:hypothetical protein PG2009B_1724 [Bifidobacterium pseudolongum subsp. globosum]
MTLFQSTPPRREVTLFVGFMGWSALFQSTPPRREVTALSKPATPTVKISIHTSPKGDDTC